jgi:hypothetical protein
MFQSWLAPIADGLRDMDNETVKAVVVFRLNSEVVNVLINSAEDLAHMVLNE